MELKITGGLIYKDGKTTKKDIGIEKGKIKSIKNEVGKAQKEIEASGCLVLPGLVNSHTHSAMTLMRGYSDSLPLQEWLEEIWKVEEKLKPEDVRIGTKLACAEMIKTGTTAFGDMYFHMDEVTDIVEKSGLRARLGYGMIGDGEKGKEELQKGTEFAKKSVGERIKKMITPHSPYTCDDFMLSEAAKRAKDLDIPLHTHLNETEQEIEKIVEEKGKLPTVYLNSLNFWDTKGFVAHGTHLKEEEIEILSKKNIGIAHCPSANMKLGSGTSPVEKIIEEGIKVGLGTDGPASNNNLDLLEEMKQAALLLNLKGIQLPSKKFIDMATKNGCDLLGLNGGKIKEGSVADLIIIDIEKPNLSPKHNLLSNLVYSTKGENVRTTIVNGKILMEKRQIKTLNEKQILEDAEKRAKDLVSRSTSS